MPIDFDAQRVTPMPNGYGGCPPTSVHCVRAAKFDRQPIDAANTSSPVQIGRNECPRGAVDGALASPIGTPLGGNPAVAPRGIEHLDFAPQCQIAFLDNGFRCKQPAEAYIEFHMVGHCKRFDCDEAGNACGFVCAGHLDALEYTAECTVRELRPAAPVRWLSRRIARCPTCDRSIVFVSDILQVVVML
ncbi:hypothetical protein [Mycobacterium sp. E3339]|uniref:hypothetical protein n=2 Tax=unclassified Mycobacterium TaxID=2642494 RepID=UPI000A709674|nr:hypothetical protein [Mycobacterium sp. E3339]